MIPITWLSYEKNVLPKQFFFFYSIGILGLQYFGSTFNKLLIIRVYRAYSISASHVYFNVFPYELVTALKFTRPYSVC